MGVARIGPDGRDLFLGQGLLEIADGKIKRIFNSFLKINLENQVHAPLQIKAQV